VLGPTLPSSRRRTTAALVFLGDPSLGDLSLVGSEI